MADVGDGNKLRMTTRRTRCALELCDRIRGALIVSTSRRPFAIRCARAARCIAVGPNLRYACVSIPNPMSRILRVTLNRDAEEAIRTGYRRLRLCGRDDCASRLRRPRWRAGHGKTQGFFQRDQTGFPAA